MQKFPIGEVPFSLGVHTFSLYQRLHYEHSDELFGDFFEYQRKTGLLDYIKPDKKKPGMKKYIFKYKHNIGIEWRFLSLQTTGFTKYGDPMTINGLMVIINPKIFAGVEDYITAANESDMNRIEELFNAESKKISDWLPLYHTYSKSRIDYCLNCNIKTAEMGCTPTQMMELIERGDIPAHYKDGGYEDSHYLKCGCAHINCYSKKDKGYPDIIRFEAQYSSSKIRAIPNKNKFSAEVCQDVIRNNFNKVVGTGNYYTLANAIKMLNFQVLNTTEKNRLIHWLEFVNQCRGITKAKERLKDKPKELSALKRALKDLQGFGINGVTVPKDWLIEKWWVNDFGIRYIPTLLNAYYDSIIE